MHIEGSQIRRSVVSVKSKLSSPHLKEEHHCKNVSSLPIGWHQYIFPGRQEGIECETIGEIFREKLAVEIAAYYFFPECLPE